MVRVQLYRLFFWHLVAEFPGVEVRLQGANREDKVRAFDVLGDFR